MASSPGLRVVENKLKRLRLPTGGLHMFVAVHREYTLVKERCKTFMAFHRGTVGYAVYRVN